MAAAMPSLPSDLLAARGLAVFPRSPVEHEGAVFGLASAAGVPRLLIAGPDSAAAGFEAAERLGSGRDTVRVCPVHHANAERLRAVLPNAGPSPLAANDATFGTGDRLGLAGPGHLAVFRRYAASPVLAQQSLRELTLTSRTYEEVLDASTWAVFREGWHDAWGADGDHLKTEEWVRRALAIGYTMITADVSDFIHGEWAATSDAEALARWQTLDAGVRRGLEERHLRSPLPVDTGEAIRFTPAELARTTLVYREAVDHAARLYRACVAEKGEGRFDFELSIDETATPTTPQAHVFMARESARQGVAISSLAPRFVGEFQKGIDYIGDVRAFEASFAVHAALCRALGHRISVHSGSDKFSVFPAIGRLSRGRFHVKTAGTSWLEALRVVAAADPALFRDLYAHARRTYDNARKLYHVTPELSRLPDPAGLPAAAASALLDDRDARQVLHITYGEMLTVPDLKRRLFDLLAGSADAYAAALERHIGRHLASLGVPPRR
jgi:tagaturonate epimerase